MIYYSGIIIPLIKSAIEKHIDVIFTLIRGMIESKVIMVKKVVSEDNIVDMFIK